MFPRKHNRKANPFLIPTMLLSAASLCHAAGGQGVANAMPGSSLNRLATDWEDIWDLLDDVDDVSPGDSTVDSTSANRSTEDGNLAKAADQSERFKLSGIRENATVSERVDAMAAISAIRLEMLSNPAEFLEPEWDAYTQTLDEIEAALEDQSEELGEE